MRFGIIGAGPSGLTMAMFLKYPYEVLEKENFPGGHASSFKDKGFTFDHGPHIIFAVSPQNKPYLDFMIATLGKNIHQCKRNNKIFYKGRLIKYPFENDLKSLPLEDNFQCLYYYLYNPYKKRYACPKNLKQWFLKNFGKGICEKYLFPYNEKVWNIPVQKLSMLWSQRIPNPPQVDIIKSAIGFETEGYKRQLYYYYPLKGGYQTISEAWAKKVRVIYNFNVKKIIKTDKNTFVVTDGKIKREYDYLISTIPIHELIKITNLEIPKKVRQAVRNLIVNPMLSVSFGIRGEDNNKFTAVYFPDKDFLVNRINFPKTFSPYNTPKNHYSIQADITCKKNSLVLKQSDNEIIKYVKDNLIRKKIIPKDDKIIYEKLIRRKYSYVVYDRNYEKNTKVVRKWFPSQGIHLVGRFSYFEYVNVDGVIARSLEIASNINKTPVRLVGDKVIKFLK